LGIVPRVSTTPSAVVFLVPQVSPKSDKRRDYIIALRKQNLSICDIVQALEADGEALSPAMIAIILKNDHNILEHPTAIPKDP
jgi:hypothetical protein